MLILGAEHQRQAMTMSEAIDAVAVALQEVSAGRTVTPMRTALPVTEVGGTALFMPSYVPSAAGLGVKFVSVFPNNRRLNKKTIYGVLVLADSVTAEPFALLEASYLTQLRTGAATGLATRFLAPPDARVLAVVGTGVQAQAAVDAVCTVRPIEEIRLFNRTAAKAVQFADDLRTRYPALHVLVADTADDAVAGADIVVTATNSSTPVFSADALGERVHVNAIGSFRPDMQEIPAELFLHKPKVVVESREAALEETGDLRIPIQRGLFSSDGVYAELGELAAEEKAGREVGDGLTLFKSVGLAAMDVVVGRIMYTRAKERGLGCEVKL